MSVLFAASVLNKAAVDGINELVTESGFGCRCVVRWMVEPFNAERYGSSGWLVSR